MDVGEGKTRKEALQPHGRRSGGAVPPAGHKTRCGDEAVPHSHKARRRAQASGRQTDTRASSGASTTGARCHTHLPLALCPGQLHLLQHLGPLLHHQRLLVGERGDVVFNLPDPDPGVNKHDGDTWPAHAPCAVRSVLCAWVPTQARPPWPRSPGPGAVSVRVTACMRTAVTTGRPPPGPGPMTTNTQDAPEGRTPQLWALDAAACCGHDHTCRCEPQACKGQEAFRAPKNSSPAELGSNWPAGRGAPIPRPGPVPRCGRGPWARSVRLGPPPVNPRPRPAARSTGAKSKARGRPTRPKRPRPRDQGGRRLRRAPARRQRRPWRKPAASRGPRGRAVGAAPSPSPPPPPRR